jgi:hypothetical protein
MANFWVRRESCAQKLIANSHKLRIGSGFLLSPPHTFASTSEIRLLKISHKKAPIQKSVQLRQLSTLQEMEFTITTLT